MSASTKAFASLTGVLDLFRNIDTDVQANAIQVFLLVASCPDPDGISMQDIGKKTGISQAGVSRNVALFTDWTRHRTEGPGLLQRTEDIMNRRQKRVRLTPKGQRFADTILKALRP